MFIGWLELHLRVMSPFAVAHTLCASREVEVVQGLWVSEERCLLLTVREMKISAWVIRIQKKIRGNHVFFRDN